MRRSGLILVITLLGVLGGLLWGAWHVQQLNIDVGDHHDAAFLRHFRAPEVAPAEVGGYSFQWTYARSTVTLPAASSADRWLATLRIFQRPDSGPARVQAQTVAGTVNLQIQPGLRQYALFVPGHTLTLLSDTSNIGDPEIAQLGVAVDTLRATRVARTPWLSIELWGLALALVTALGVWAWLLRLSLADLTLAGAALIGLVALAATRWFVRMGIAVPLISGWALGTAAAGWLLGLPLRRWLGPAGGYVAAALMLALFTKGVGLSYPGFQPTDSPFHLNRLQLSGQGFFFLTAEGQGQTYPYPPGVYLLLLPLTGLGLSGPLVIAYAGLVVDTATIVVLAWLLQRLEIAPRATRYALLLYAVLPVGFLLALQNPLAQNMGQWLTIVYMAGLLAVLARPPAPQERRQVFGALVGLGFVSALGHFGVFLNMALLWVVLALLDWRRWWQSRRWMFTAVLGGLLAVIIYYSAFITLVLNQVDILTEQPTDPLGLRWYLLRRFVLDLGLYGHYYVVWVVLAVIGLWRLWRHGSAEQRYLAWWLNGLLVTGLLLNLAVVTILFNSTRSWVLIFPAVAVGAGLALDWASQRRWGPWAARALLLLTLAAALSQWAGLIALHERGFLL